MSEENALNSKQSYNDDAAPPRKKIKVVSAWNKQEKLEDKLNHILSCTVCLDLPSSACMQCCHGHLMCIGCYHHLLADARLKDEQSAALSRGQRLHFHYNSDCIMHILGSTHTLVLLSRPWIRHFTMIISAWWLPTSRKFSGQEFEEIHRYIESLETLKQPTCPSCRVDISRGMCTRNLAVEKTISELPVQCVACCETFSRNCIVFHHTNECPERMIACKFQALGCSWTGRAHERDNHTAKCQHPRKNPEELLQCLDEINKQQHEKVSSLQHVISLLSCEHISYMEVQLRPHRTDDFVTKLFYESNRFHLMGHSWLIKAFVSAVEEHPSNPTISSDRKLTYQLVLKTKITEPLEVDCMFLRAPYDEVEMKPSPHFTKFTSDLTESQIYPLPVSDVNRLLGSKVINLRLFMFQHK